MTVVVLLCGVLLAIGGALALIRAERGPSMLDRTVALDIVVTVLVAAVALYASVDRRTDVVRAYSYRQLLTRPFLGGGFVTALSVPLIASWGLPVFTIVMLVAAVALTVLGMRRRRGDVPVATSVPPHAQRANPR